MASFPRVVFSAIDVLFDIPQNGRRYNNINVKKNVVYDPKYPKTCAMDFYRHKDKLDVKLPTIINFHGGGYMAGNKKYRSGVAGYYVDKLDICVINVGYHLCEKHPFPQFTIDSMNAIQWIFDHADEYNLDKDNIFVMGDSAGAQIAAHAMTIIENPELAERIGCVCPKVKFKGAFLFCGPYDVMGTLNRRLIGDIGHMIGNKVMGINTRNKEALANYKYKKEVSLLEWITPGFPQAYIAHTLADVVCYGNSEMLMEKLDGVGVPYEEFKSVNKADFHCWYLTHNGRSAERCLQNSVDAFKAMLNGTFAERAKEMKAFNAAEDAKRAARKAKKQPEIEAAPAEEKAESNEEK